MVTVGRDELGLRLELLVQQMTENERAVFERLRLRALDQGDGVAIVLMLLGFVGFPDLHLIRSGKRRASRLWCVLGLFLGGVLLLAVVRQLPLTRWGLDCLGCSRGSHDCGRQSLGLPRFSLT